MRVLLTGATGFVGREVALELHARGHALSCLVRGTDPGERHGRAGLPGSVCPGELEDRLAVRAAVAGADVIVHAAAIVDPALHHDPLDVVRVNRDLTVELARAAESEGARRFVFISSLAAMGFWSGVAVSESPCRPDSPYGRAKLEAERILLSMKRPGFEVVVLRPPTVYGPGEPYNFLQWVRSVERGLFRIIGSGRNDFPLATTRNVARATRAAAEGSLASGVYLVADGEAYTMERIHRAISRSLGRAPKRLRIPIPVALAAGLTNEAVRQVWSKAPLLLSRARVRTLTVSQRLDVEPLLRAGVELDAPLEEWVELTIRDYERRGALIP